MRYEIKRIHVERYACYLDLWNREQKINIELKLCDNYNNFKIRHKSLIEILDNITDYHTRVTINDIEFMFYASKKGINYKFAIDYERLEFYIDRNSFNEYLADKLSETTSIIF